MKKKLLSDIGEFGFIERIAGKVSSMRGVIQGIGDDCAILSHNATHYMLVTTDMLIEDIHFTLDASIEHIARKALNVSISDIASMAGVPRYATISVGLPPSMSVEQADELVRGLVSAAKAFDIIIVGGDTNSSANLIIETTVIGYVKKKHCVKRSGAKKNDVIFVTGALGGSIQGHHLKFTPRVKEAQLISQSLKINSMIDISDGLVNDLSHIIEKSNVGAIIYEEKIPFRKGVNNLDNALFDGEDFELLFTISKKNVTILEDVMKKNKIKCSCIGSITDHVGELVCVDSQGNKRKPERKGWRHF